MSETAEGLAGPLQNPAGTGPELTVASDPLGGLPSAVPPEQLQAVFLLALSNLGHNSPSAAEVVEEVSKWE